MIEKIADEHTGEIQDDVIHVQPSPQGKKLRGFNEEKQEKYPQEKPPKRAEKVQ